MEDSTTSDYDTTFDDYQSFNDITDKYLKKQKDDSQHTITYNQNEQEQLGKTQFSNNQGLNDNNTRMQKHSQTNIKLGQQETGQKKIQYNNVPTKQHKSIFLQSGDKMQFRSRTCAASSAQNNAFNNIQYSHRRYEQQQTKNNQQSLLGSQKPIQSSSVNKEIAECRYTIREMKQFADNQLAKGINTIHDAEKCLLEQIQKIEYTIKHLDSQFQLLNEIIKNIDVENKNVNILESFQSQLENIQNECKLRIQNYDNLSESIKKLQDQQQQQQNAIMLIEQYKQQNKQYKEIIDQKNEYFKDEIKKLQEQITKQENDWDQYIKETQNKQHNI